MDANEHEKRLKLNRIDSLQQSPAWDDLKVMFEDIEAAFWRRHVADVKRGKEIDQRKLDRALGMFDGIRDIIAAPAKAAEKLERLNRKNDEQETS